VDGSCEKSWRTSRLCNLGGPWIDIHTAEGRHEEDGYPICWGRFPGGAYQQMPWAQLLRRRERTALVLTRGGSLKSEEGARRYVHPGGSMRETRC
jgi:hypothetical protein